MLNVNFATAARIADAQQDNTGPRLDPAIPVFWIQNGDRKLKAVHRVLYCGGWATEAETLDKIVHDTGRTHHAALEEFEITTREGKELRCYGAQNLLVAPIARRSCWYIADSKTVLARYEPGARQWSQHLVLLAEKQDKQIVLWGAACLSAKGFQAKNLADAFSAWEKFTAPFRAEITRGLVEAKQWSDPHRVIPASLFWAPIGTFGNAPETVMVGKAGAQSPITPIRCFTEPGKLTTPILEALYMGDVALAEAGLVLDAHTEWLSAWRDQANGNGANPLSEPAPADTEIAEAAPF